MSHSRATAKAILFTIGAGLLSSACAGEPDSPPPSAYNEPNYGSLDSSYADWAGWGGYNDWQGWRAQEIGADPDWDWIGGGHGGGHG